MSWIDVLNDFCKAFHSDVSNRSTESDELDSESLVLLTTYSEKSQGTLNQLDSKEEKTWEEDGRKILKDVSQLMLDVTYITEVQLVDSEFPENRAEKDIKYIIDSLSSLEDLSKKLCPDEDVVECLGAELVECLRWRKGALLYMYCHTLYYSDSGIQTHQLHYVEEGVNYLVSMLKTRCKAKWIDNVKEIEISKDKDTLQLIEQGIFSDTHLLAMMYCGELCYWYMFHPSFQQTSKTTSLKNNSSKNLTPTCTKDITVTENKSAKNSKSSGSENCDENHSKSAVKSNEHNDVFCKMLQVGNSCLKKYISVVNGPLSDGGWNTAMATTIIDKFKDLKL